MPLSEEEAGGTALAIVLSRSRRSHAISVWVHDAKLGAVLLRDSRENNIYLPGYTNAAGSGYHIGHLRCAFANAEIVLGVVPAPHARIVYTAMREHLMPGAIIVSASKGIEEDSHFRMSEVIAEVCSRHSGKGIAVLSGPSFAREVARGDPTAVVIASHDAGLASELQEEFAGATLRLYTNDDVIGVEIGGAVKNVIAIAAGVCAGLNLGANTTAALLTRGLAEMTRLAVALGGRRDTLAGLAGMGDLVLTSTGEAEPQSRGWCGTRESDARSKIFYLRREMVAGRRGTTAATRELARRAKKLKMPITGAKCTRRFTKIDRRAKPSANQWNGA